jgi:TatD DNase family protein
LADRPRQEKLFRAHIALAREANKPLMLHVRSPRGSDAAYRDALAILADYSGCAADFHFFSGSWEVAKDIIDAGFFLSFDGPITFARDYDEVIRNAPLERIMAETDCPYAAPAPNRGKRNEPLFVREVVAAIARIRNAEQDMIERALLANSRAFFSV